MHIGIVGPCSSGPLAEFLPDDAGVDLGWGGFPIVNLVRTLIRRGHRVSVITLSPQVSDRRILKGPQLTYYVYPTRLKKRMRDLYHVERDNLREGIELARPDLLHAQWTYEFALACFETDLPTVVTIHDNAFRVLSLNRDLYRLGRLCLQISVLRKARFLTAVSPYVARSLGRLAKFEIEVIPNIVEPWSRIDIEPEKDGPVRIATVLNGWQNLKNPKLAIKAFDLLRIRHPNAEMYMYGFGFEEGGVASAWAASKGLAQNIQFCGPISHHDLQKELRKMSVLLHPSLEEACPMSIIEAMAIGLPVIGGKGSGAVDWVLDEGRAGFLTNVRDPAQIAQTLLTCIEDPESREQRRRNAYERVVSLFSPDAVAGQYEKMYARVLAVGGPTQCAFSTF